MTEPESGLRERLIEELRQAGVYYHDAPNVAARVLPIFKSELALAAARPTDVANRIKAFADQLSREHRECEAQSVRACEVLVREAAARPTERPFDFLSHERRRAEAAARNLAPSSDKPLFHGPECDCIRCAIPVSVAPSEGPSGDGKERTWWRGLYLTDEEIEARRANSVPVAPASEPRETHAHLPDDLHMCCSCGWQCSGKPNIHYSREACEKLWCAHATAELRAALKAAKPGNVESSPAEGK